MIRIVTFGLGGYCENCDDKHDHPLHNIISTIETDEESNPDDNPEPT